MLIPHEGSTNIHINSHGLEGQDSLLPPPPNRFNNDFLQSRNLFFWEKFGVFLQKEVGLFVFKV